MNLPKLNHQISVIMCSWKSPALLRTTISSLLKSSVLDTKIFVALNEAERESIEFLHDAGIEFVTCKQNLGTLAVDLLLPFLDSEYTLWSNDDMIFSLNWDQYLIDDIKENYPTAIQVRGVEKRHTDGVIALSDLSLPDFLDSGAYDIFNHNVSNGKYQCDKVYGLFHPIMMRTSDLLAVNGVSDHFDMKWFPGHSMDTFLAYKLWSLNRKYKFVLSNKAFDYHGSSMTNKKLKAVCPAADARHNSEYFLQQTGMDHRGFHKLIRYGEKYE